MLDREHLFNFQEGRVLLNIIVKPSMFGLGIALNETGSHLFNLQSPSKYFGTLQCFNTDPINHK